MKPARQTFDEALATADQIEPPDSAFDYYSMEDASQGREWAKYWVATEQAKAGFRSGAIATACRIGEPYVRAMTLFEIATAKLNEAKRNAEKAK